jgi:glycosyltransferase involved in cell wall biosynthesis
VIEGFPNALAEAMSYGLPCIVFDDISHQDFIRDGKSGFVIKSGDLNGLADKILELTKSQELRSTFGQKNRSKSQDWSLEKVGKQLESFIFSGHNS